MGTPSGRPPAGREFSPETVTLPAVWVMAGSATLLYELLPLFAAGVSWAAPDVFQSLEFAWELQRVSQSIVDVSPFAHMHWAAPVSFARLVVIDEADRLKMAGLERWV